MLRVLEAHYCPLLYDPAFLLDRQKVGSDGLVRFGLPLLDLLGHYSIAFASSVFQPRPAFDFYRSPLVSYESGFLQDTRSHRDTGPACTFSRRRLSFEKPQFGDRCFLVGISHGEAALAPFNCGRGMNDAVPVLRNLAKCSAAKGILK
jgi:hypothetical protein